jgi:hypothetical protein
MIPTRALACTRAVFKPLALALLVIVPPFADWETMPLRSISTLPATGSRWMMPQSTWPLILKRKAGSGVSVAGIVLQTLVRRAGEEPVFVSRSLKVTVWPRFTVLGWALIVSLSFVEAWWLAGTALAATAEWATTATPTTRVVTATRRRAAAVGTATEYAGAPIPFVIPMG